MAERDFRHPADRTTRGTGGYISGLNRLINKIPFSSTLWWYINIFIEIFLYEALCLCSRGRMSWSSEFSGCRNTPVFHLHLDKLSGRSKKQNWRSWWIARNCRETRHNSLRETDCKIYLHWTFSILICSSFNIFTYNAALCILMD